MKILLVGGDEPYAVESVSRTAALKGLALPDINLMKSDVLDGKVVEHLYSCPVMDEERVAYVKVDHLKQVDNDCFKECMDMEEGKLVVVFKNYDGRSSFYKKVKQQGYVTLCNKEEYEPSLRSFLLKKASEKGVSFADDALDLMLSRVDYLSNEDANLFTFLGYLSSLSALDKVITKDMVCSIVPEFRSENVFGIAEMILKRDVNGIMVQAELLCGKEDTLRTLGALLWEYRIAYKALYYPMKEIGSSYSKFSKIGKQRIVEAIDLITSQLAAVKSGMDFKGNILADTLLRLV